jgi:F-type H+-transporting ATPase subunit gamma
VSGASEALARRISGAKDLSAVVRSMKALAASSITQYERAVESLQSSTHTLEMALSVCLRESGAMAHPANEPRHAVRRGAILIGSDQGLVGRFNESLMDFTQHELLSSPGEVSHLWVVGGRIEALVADYGLPAPVPLAIPNSVDAIAPLVNELLIDIATASVRVDMDEIHVFHNQPRGEASYAPVRMRLLPLDEQWQRHLLALPWPTPSHPQVLGSTATALDALIRGHLFVSLFQACAESLASENASRLAAMQRAEDNIAKILDELGRKFHRIRQESIDEELFDVIDGYESLTQARR